MLFHRSHFDFDIHRVLLHLPVGQHRLLELSLAMHAHTWPRHPLLWPKMRRKRHGHGLLVKVEEKPVVLAVQFLLGAHQQRLLLGVLVVPLALRLKAEVRLAFQVRRDAFLESVFGLCCIEGADLLEGKLSQLMAVSGILT